nr:phage holin [Weissella confusa]
MNNLIELLKALWEVRILPALLILAIGWASARFSRNKRLTALLGIAENAVNWAEVNFDGGQTQKAQAVKMITDYLMKADKAHLFTAKQIDDAIEWAVKEMKEGTVASSASEAPVVSSADDSVVSSGATVASSASTQGTTTPSESTTEV